MLKLLTLGDSKAKSAKEETKSSGYFSSQKEDVRSLPGKVSFLGKFFSRVAKFFSKITFWVSKKFLGTLFGRMGSGGMLKRFKDKIVMKIVLLISGILTLIFGYKGLRAYIRNRKFRKKDREINDMREEIDQMKAQLDSEIKHYRGLIDQHEKKNSPRND